MIQHPPPPHNEQLNSFVDKSDKNKFLLTTLLNFTEYQLGEAYAMYQKIYGGSEEFWKTTRAGCANNALLAINYYHICNKYFGIIYSNIR